MKKLSLFVALLLALQIFCLPVLAENSWMSESGLPIVTDPANQPELTILKLVNDVEPEDPNENLWMKKAIEDTGIKINWITVPESSATERIQMMLSTGDLPDVFWNGISRSHVLQYMDFGIFRPVEDLLQYMPNLNKIYEARPEYRAMSVAPDGHIYGFPRVEEMNGLVMTPGPVYVYQPWLDKLNIQMPATMDEWIAMLYAIKDAGDLNGNGVADEYALSWDYAEGWDYIFGWVAGAYGTLDVMTGPNNASNHLYIKDEKIEYAPLTEGFQKTAELFHQFYVDGILNPDSFAPSATGSSLHAQKLMQELPSVGVFQSWGTSGRVPDANADLYTSMPRVQGSDGKTGYIRNNVELFNTTLAMITTKCEHPELVARFVDYCFGAEQSVTLNWGAEGAVYVKDADGILRWDVDESGIYLKAKFGLENWQLRSYSTIGGPNVVLRDYYDTVVEYPRDAQRVYNEQVAGGKQELLAEYQPISPMVWFLPEEQERVDQIMPQINNVLDSTLQRWIIDGGAENEFDSFKEQLINAGVNDYLAIYQAAFDRYLANLPK